MNILYITFFCNPNYGSEAKIGWDVPLECSKNDHVYVITEGELREEIEEYQRKHNMYGPEFFYVNLPEFQKNFFNGILYSLRLNAWHRRALPLAKKLCAEKHIDIIHQITPIEIRSIGDYWKIPGVKFVCGPLGGGEFIPKGLRCYARRHMVPEILRALANYWARLKLLVSGKLDRCDYLMFANRETRDFLCKFGVTCPCEIVSEIGLREDELSCANSKPDAARCFTFLAAGRMIYRKGMDLLLDAVSEIPESLSYQVRIVGGGTALEHLRKRCADSEKLKRHVSIIGAVPYSEMGKEFSSADVFVMPSIRETTGTVLLEAMSKGVPVITINRFGGMVIYDESTGWQYSGDSKQSYIEGLKNAMVECILNPDEVHLRGENARKEADKYTWENKIRTYRRIYENLLM